MSPPPAHTVTQFFMSLHSYSRVWLHLIWATLERRPLISKTAAPKLSRYLSDYASQKSIYMKITYVNAEHVHALIDLPTSLTIEEVMQFLKGSSSHWINETRLVPGKFAWGRGYAALSVSHSGVERVAKYIANQEQHHQKKSFSEEFKLFVERYGLKWFDD